MFCWQSLDELNLLDLSSFLMWWNWLSEGWDSGLAVGLNTEVINLPFIVTLDWELEETILTPVGSPRVSADPVLLAIISGTPSNDRDFVVELWIREVLRVDSTSVFDKVVGGLDTATNWSIFVELSLHVVGSGEFCMALSIVVSMLNGPAFIEAGLTGWTWWPSAVSADVNGVACFVIKVVSDVLLAR